MLTPKGFLTAALQHLLKAESGLLDQRGTIRVSQAERHTRAASKQVRLALEWLREEGELRDKMEATEPVPADVPKLLVNELAEAMQAIDDGPEMQFVYLEARGVQLPVSRDQVAFPANAHYARSRLKSVVIAVALGLYKEGAR